ncbi:MAG: tandem-95 repeat protein [Gallionella sp.]
MNGKTTTMMLFGKALPKGLLLAALLSVSAPTLAAEYWLQAQAFNKTIAGESIRMWGYARCVDKHEDNGVWACDEVPAAVPGPALFVPAGDPQGLIVHLRNKLPVPTSLIINGQIIAMTPVWDDGSSGSRTSATQRVRSFTHEAPARVGNVDGFATYTWPAIRQGTYLYQSGTHPQVQVQMGLYGALTSATPSGPAEDWQIPPTNQVYGVAYDKSVTLLFSEIDPALHAAVANGTYGNALLGGPTSTLNYAPKYFLINGRVRNNTPLFQSQAGEKVLLRFLNAGLQTRVPMINGAYLSLIAEDGNAYPWAGNPRQQYTVFLPAAKTVDAIFTGKLVNGANTLYTVYDRRLALNNNATPDGGMMGVLQVLKVGAPPVFSLPTTAMQTVAQNALFSAQAAATVTLGNPIAYTLDQFPAGMSTTPAGAITWTPDSSQVGNHLVTVRAEATTGWFATRSFPITVTDVADNPVANNDSYTISQDTLLSVAAPGVLANDTDPDSGTVLTAVNYTTPSQGTLSFPAMPGNGANGSFSYTPPLGFTGVATFTYVASDGILLSNPATATVNVIANRPPVATTDTVDAPIRRNIATTGNIDITTGANTLTVASTAWMKVSDPITVSGAGVATITGATDLTTTILAINGNVLTLASPAAVSVTGTAVTVSYTPVLINVLVNDTDPDYAIDITNTIAPNTVTIVTSPTQGGTVTVDAVTGIISYTPSLNFGGADSFTYFVRDTLGATSNTVIVRVNVVM